MKNISPFSLGLIVALLCSLPLTAAILPEDRADFLFHYYDGGGVTIQGPAIQARKKVSNNLSLSAKYYIDSVTSASIDVVSYASPYTEERKEKDFSLDFLRGSSAASLSYAVSEESDYFAKSYHFSISQDMFGELTTLTIGYSKGDDEVKRNNYAGGRKVSTTIIGDVDRNQFRVGLSQILSKNFIVNVSHESITDEALPAQSGFTPLNNPYRSAFYHDFDPGLGIDLCLIPCATVEQYPNTRSSNATALKAIYYLPYRASIRAEVRQFSDTWGIKSEMFDIGYTQPIKRDLIFDFHFRSYSQTQASFYADQFASRQTFMARDKEMSTFTSTTAGARISYNFIKRGGWLSIDKGTLNVSYDMIQFNYANFYNRAIEGGGMDWGTDVPLYSFSADVYQFYVSLWY